MGQAQGWYRDPYAIHEDRYFSAGQPTKLVRDGEQESYDSPPDRPVPDGDLVSAEQATSESDGTDLRRADDAGSDSFDPAKARRAAFDVFDMTSGQW